MATFSEIKATLDEISRRNIENRKRIESALNQIAIANNDLGDMPSVYASVVNEIDQAVTDNPDVTAFEVAQSEKDQLVADFQELKSVAASALAALDPIVNS